MSEGAHMNQRVDRLEVGVEYELNSGTRATFVQVMGPDLHGFWRGMTREGVIRMAHRGDMPFLAAPAEPTTPTPTWEWRQLQANDTYMTLAGQFNRVGPFYNPDKPECRWVAVLPQVTP